MGSLISVCVVMSWGVSVFPKCEIVIPQPIVCFIAPKGRTVRTSCWQVPRLLLREAEEGLRDAAVRAFVRQRAPEQSGALCTCLLYLWAQKELEFHSWIFKGDSWSLAFVFLVPLTLCSIGLNSLRGQSSATTSLIEFWSVGVTTR